MPVCCDCKQTLPRGEFAKSQAKKPAEARRCLDCAAKVQCGSNTGTSSNTCNDGPSTSSGTSHWQRVDLPPGVGSSAPVEPGRKAKMINLVGRKELNGTGCKIERLLPNGRVAVTVRHLPNTPLEHTEQLSVKPENLDVSYNCDPYGTHKTLDGGAVKLEECPICFERVIDPNGMSNDSASIWECCGQRTCNRCFVEQNTRGTNTDACPLCRADLSDCSPEACLKRIQVRADRGDANAMYNLGGFYDYGQAGVRMDQALARVWYEKAALKGEARAANNLGCSARDGEGGPINKQLAAKWFKVGAELGHVQAATNYAIALMRGDGVEKDVKAAERWLKASAKAGDELAEQQLEVLQMMNSGEFDRYMSSMTIGPSGITFKRG